MESILIVLVIATVTSKGVWTLQLVCMHESLFVGIITLCICSNSSSLVSFCAQTCLFYVVCLSLLFSLLFYLLVLFSPSLFSFLPLLLCMSLPFSPSLSVSLSLAVCLSPSLSSFFSF